LNLINLCSFSIQSISAMALLSSSDSYGAAFSIEPQLDSRGTDLHDLNGSTQANLFGIVGAYEFQLPWQQITVNQAWSTMTASTMAIKSYEFSPGVDFLTGSLQAGSQSSGGFWNAQQSFANGDGSDAITGQNQASTRKIVIGIHSNVDPDAGFTDGHAWISIYDSDTGLTTNYGLWPDSHPRTPDNGDGTDVRIGMEDGYLSEHSRYVEITPDQLEDFEDFADNVDTWGYMHTCAEWATDAWSETTGEWVDPNDYFGYETPRMVSQSIIELEKKDPTSPGTPGNTGGQGAGGTSCWGE
jgi:hypothetical protein